jgi:hypothetical protein
MQCPAWATACYPLMSYFWPLNSNYGDRLLIRTYANIQAGTNLLIRYRVLGLRHFGGGGAPVFLTPVVSYAPRPILGVRVGKIISIQKFWGSKDKWNVFLEGRAIWRAVEVTENYLRYWYFWLTWPGHFTTYYNLDLIRQVLWTRWYTPPREHMEILDRDLTCALGTRSALTWQGLRMRGGGGNELIAVKCSQRCFNSVGNANARWYIALL